MKQISLLGGGAALALLAACGEPVTEEDASIESPAAEAEGQPAAGAAPDETDAADVESESQRLNAWLDDQFEAFVERSPIQQTFLGRKDDYGQWDNLSPEYRAETQAMRIDTLQELRAEFDPADLDADARLSYRLFETQLETSIETFEEWGDYVLDVGSTRTYAFTQMGGAHTGIPALLVNQHSVASVEDADAYISRLNAVGAYLEQSRVLAQEAFDEGVFPPKFVFDHVIDSARNVITGAPFDDGEPSVIWADVTGKIDALEIDAAAKEDLRERARSALLDSVGPAYEALIADMESQKAEADERDGAWKLPRGEDYYAFRLSELTTTDMTADEIHQLGLAETRRIHDEMRGIMQEVGFEGTLREFFEFMRTDEQFYYENTDAGRERYLEEARAIIDNMRGRLDELFLTFPEADLIVKRVEPFREKSAGKAFYQRPAADGSRPGTYYANLYDMANMPTYQMEALAYHEGLPGHHMQIAIAQELEGVPKFRKFGGHTAYIEGWGLYSEWAPKEMGLYEDPYSDFGRLAMELWRAGRLVVDTGIHSKEWTRQEAIDWLTENTPNPEGDAINAIERYIVMPGQATAYKIGMIKIQDLRARAEEALGEDFDVREYHDLVLANGSMPLSILEEQVDAWIAEQQDS